MPAADVGAEARRVHELGGEPGAVRVELEVEEADRPCPADPEAGLHLTLEPPPELGVVGEFLPHEFDGHLAERAVGQIDDAHSAAAEPADQPVPPQHGRFPRP